MEVETIGCGNSLPFIPSQEHETMIGDIPRHSRTSPHPPGPALRPGCVPRSQTGPAHFRGRNRAALPRELRVLPPAGRHRAEGAAAPTMRSLPGRGPSPARWKTATCRPGTLTPATGRGRTTSVLRKTRSPRSCGGFPPARPEETAKSRYSRVRNAAASGRLASPTGSMKFEPYEGRSGRPRLVRGHPD